MFLHRTRFSSWSWKFTSSAWNFMQREYNNRTESVTGGSAARRKWGKCNSRRSPPEKSGIVFAIWGAFLLLFSMWGSFCYVFLLIGVFFTIYESLFATFFPCGRHFCLHGGPFWACPTSYENFWGRLNECDCYVEWARLALFIKKERGRNTSFFAKLLQLG